MDASFSWRGFAASVVGSYTSSGLSVESTGHYGIDILTDTVSGFAGAAASSALRGESFRDNAGRILTDAFGNALANVAKRGISESSQSSSQGAKNKNVAKKRGDSSDVGGHNYREKLDWLSESIDNPLESPKPDDQMLLASTNPMVPSDESSTLLDLRKIPVFVGAEDAVVEYLGLGDITYDEAVDIAFDELIENDFIKQGVELCLEGGAEPDVYLAAAQFEEGTSDTLYVPKNKVNYKNTAFALYNVRQYKDIFTVDNWRAEFSGPMFNEPDAVGLYQGKGPGLPNLGVGVDLVGDARGVDVSRWQRQELSIKGTIKHFSRTTRNSNGDTSLSHCVSYDLETSKVGTPTRVQDVRYRYNFGTMKLPMPSPIDFFIPGKL